jgi:hypothetical protein
LANKLETRALLSLRYPLASKEGEVLSKSHNSVEEKLKAKFPKLYEHFEKKNFSDVALQSWCILELFANDAILKAYGLSSIDPCSEPLLQMRIYRKLDLLKKLCYILEDESQILNDFRKRRNDLVHKIGGGLFFIDESEKQKIIENTFAHTFLSHTG